MIWFTKACTWHQKQSYGISQSQRTFPVHCHDLLNFAYQSSNKDKFLLVKKQVKCRFNEALNEMLYKWSLGYFWIMLVKAIRKGEEMSSLRVWKSSAKKRMLWKCLTLSVSEEKEVSNTLWAVTSDNHLANYLLFYGTNNILCGAQCKAKTGLSCLKITIIKWLQASRQQQQDIESCKIFLCTRPQICGQVSVLKAGLAGLR